ncbi:MAG TPA: hypothetical protein VGO47_13030 [Chlamydiales bacterium]|nr:hypothetical protein [Chlamydiales bacterium]
MLTAILVRGTAGPPEKRPALLINPASGTGSGPPSTKVSGKMDQFGATEQQ